jgi:hypothetical protein
LLLKNELIEQIERVKWDINSKSDFKGFYKRIEVY